MLGYAQPRLATGQALTSIRSICWGLRSSRWGLPGPGRAAILAVRVLVQVFRPDPG